MASTLRDLITSSLRLTNVVQTNETPTADDMDISLEALNALIDSWSTERLDIYTVKPYRFTLTPGQQDYTLGAGGDWDVARPMNIQQASVMLNPVVISPYVAPEVPSALLSYTATSTPTHLAVYEAFIADVMNQYDWGDWDALNTGSAITVTGADATNATAGAGSTRTLNSGAGYPTYTCFEVTIGDAVPTVGLFPTSQTYDANVGFTGATNAVTYAASGAIVGRTDFTATGPTFTTGDVIGVVLFQQGGGYGDSRVAFFKNGVLTTDTWSTMMNSLYDVYPSLTFGA